MNVFHVDCAGLRHDKLEIGYGAYNLIFFFGMESGTLNRFSFLSYVFITF